MIVEPEETSCLRDSFAESGLKRSTNEYSSVFELLRERRLNVEVVPIHTGPRMVLIGTGGRSGSGSLIPGPVKNVFFILSPAA